MKTLVRSLVNKVARRLAPRYRKRSQANPKETTENNPVDGEQKPPQPRNPRRGRGARHRGNGYFIEHGKIIIPYRNFLFEYE